MGEAVSDYHAMMRAPVVWSTCQRCRVRIHRRFGAWWEDGGTWPCPSDGDPDAVHVPIDAAAKTESEN